MMRDRRTTKTETHEMLEGRLPEIMSMFEDEEEEVRCNDGFSFNVVCEQSITIYDTTAANGSRSRHTRLRSAVKSLVLASCWCIDII